MPFVYAPDGTPYSVPQAEVDSFVRKGFRTQKPEEPVKSTPPTLDTTTSGGIEQNGVVVANNVQRASDLTPTDGEATGATASAPVNSKVKINSCSLKELVALPGVSTAIARKVVENRPYATAEDLISKVELTTGDWLAVSNKLSFE